MERRKNKKSMRNKNREEEKRESEYQDKVMRVSAAIEAGYIQRRDLAHAADVKLHDLNNIFTKERELYASYCVRRKTIKDLAADNIYAVVEDRSHPKNYEASKWVAEKFKTDLDDSLESKSDDNLGVSVSNEGSESGRITIRFGKKTSEDLDE